MQTPIILKKLFIKRIDSIELILFLLLAIIMLPYLALSFFNAPAVDDYSYALKTMDYGFWGGQMEAYKQWNGRYFASFILCLNIISGNTFIMYKLLPIVLMIGNTHAIYKLMNIIAHKQNRVLLLLFSLIFTLIFLNFMPSISQGVYWAPGAITYNLGNIMVVYLFGMLINSHHINLSKVKKTSTVLITILACGLNESSMVAVDLMIIVFLLYHFLTTRKLNSFLLLLLLLAITCTVIMAVSPGNHIRDTGFLDPHKKNVVFTITSSFNALFGYLSVWLFTWRMLILSALSILFFTQLNKETISAQQAWVRLLLVTVLGFSIVAAALAPGFWSTGYIAPDRTINAVYWLFLVWWFSLLYCVAVFLQQAITKFAINKVIVLIASGLICSSFYFQENNYQRAVFDVITGRGYIYSLEFKNRLELISKNLNAGLCELPEFSVIPGTIFHEDIKADEEEWFNKEFARFYGLSKVRLGKRETQTSRKVSINFENDPTVKFKTPVSLSTAFAHSTPNSNLLNGENTYSATYETLIKDIDPTGLAFKTVVIEANVLSTFNAVDYVLVVSINDGSDKNILWQGKDIKNGNYPINSWNKESFAYTIKESAALKPENKIAVYLWNRSKNAIYVDDIDITFQ